MSKHTSITFSVRILVLVIAAAGQADALPAHCATGGIQENVEVFPTLTGSTWRSRPTTDSELLNVESSERGRFAAGPALDNKGWIDGVYACDVTLGGTTERALISMNGKADGSTIYAVASMKTYYEAGRTTPSKPIDQPFRGYGVGSITAAGYVGKTWNGQPFSFTLLGLEESTSQKKYDVLRIKGSVGIDASRTAQLVCKTDRALF